MYLHTSTAQVNLPEQCVVGLPRIISSELIKVKDVKQLIQSSNWGQTDKLERYWVVYSDRDNNITYNKPDKTSGHFGYLHFNEELRIAKLQNGFALVYKEEKTNSVYPKINKGVSCGWVPMTRLLLWSSCPTNDFGIYHKAFPQLNFDEFGLINLSITDKKSYRVFDNPISKSNPKELPDNIDFFFVMKEDKESGMVLLSKHYELWGINSQVLYGWVDKNSYIPRDNRVCLEPNWNHEVAEKLKGKNVDICLSGVKIHSVPLGRENSLGPRATKYRMLPNEMRLPVLAEKDDQYIILSFIKTNKLKDGGLYKEILTSENGGVIAFKGYIDKRDFQTGYDLWQPVILISEDEFKDLMSNLQGVMTAVSRGSEDRRPYVNAMKTLVRTMIPDITEAQMQQKGNKEIMAMVAGLNISSDAFRGRTLEEIQNKNIVTNEEFINLIMNFKDKFNNLDRTRTSKYEYSIMRNGTRWFWIPVSNLP